MTRKDYILIAEALRRNRPGENWDGNKLVQWEGDVDAISAALKCDNSRFDRDRFVAACGGRFARMHAEAV